MTEKAEKKKKVTAKKDFVIHQNAHHYVINKGDDIESLNIPKQFYENLKTEKVT